MDFDQDVYYYAVDVIGHFQANVDSRVALDFMAKWPSDTLIDVRLNNIRIDTNFNGDLAEDSLELDQGEGDYTVDVYIFLGGRDMSGVWDDLPPLEKTCQGIEILMAGQDESTFEVSPADAAAVCNVCYYESGGMGAGAVCDDTTTVSIYRIVMSAIPTPSSTAADVSLVSFRAFVSSYVDTVTDGSIETGVPLEVRPAVDPEVNYFVSELLQHDANQTAWVAQGCEWDGSDYPSCLSTAGGSLCQSCPAPDISDPVCTADPVQLRVALETKIQIVHSEVVDDIGFAYDHATYSHNVLLEASGVDAPWETGKYSSHSH